MQRLVTLGLSLLLVAFSVAFASGAGLPWWASAILAGAICLLFNGLIQKTSPGTPAPFLRCADYISRAFLKAAAPLLAMAIAYLFIGKDLGSAAVALVIVVVIGGVLYYIAFPGPVAEVVGSLVRGRPQPVTSSDIIASEVKLPPGDEGITWGGLRIPSKAATSHFMVVGTTGSGKSVTLQLLMQEVLQPIGRGGDHRALIYDAKQDIVSSLVGMGLACHIVTLNPFDSRSVAWDMAKDVTDPATALQVASTLFPRDENTSQPFFVDAAQTLLYGVIIAFIKRKSEWRFSDLIRTMQDAVTLKKMLSLVPETEHFVRLLFENADTLNNVMATVATKALAYEPIAAMWDQAHKKGHTISLNEWVQNRGTSNYILILGNSEQARRPLDALNQVIFKRVSELLLDQKENKDDTRRSWIFLDEVAEAGRLDGLSSLLAKGRSKGVCVVLGFQDIEGLRTVYGVEETNSLTGQCNNKAILRVESPPTGEWASKLFGSYEAIEVRKNVTHGTSRERGLTMNSPTISESTTYAEEYVQRQSVLESEFSTIPVTNEINGLSGYYIVPSIGTYKHTYAGDWLFSKGANALVQPVSDVSNFAKRSPDTQFLRPWFGPDYHSLNFPEIEPIVDASSEEQAELNAFKPKKGPRDTRGMGVNLQ